MNLLYILYIEQIKKTVGFGIVQRRRQSAPPLLFFLRGGLAHLLVAAIAAHVDALVAVSAARRSGPLFPAALFICCWTKDETATALVEDFILTKPSDLRKLVGAAYTLRSHFVARGHRPGSIQQMRVNQNTCRRIEGKQTKQAVEYT